jgi:hypothetical protein
MPAKRKGTEVAKDTSKKQKQDEKKEGEYGWQELSKDLLDKKYMGTYGGCNSAWHALAAIRADVDLTKFHTHRSPDEFFLQSLDKHVKTKRTQRNWDKICSFDPMGLYGAPPTMAATYACMEILS